MNDEERKREILAEQKTMNSASTSNMSPVEKIQFHLDYMELVCELEEIALAIAAQMRREDAEQDAHDFRESMRMRTRREPPEENVRY